MPLISQATLDGIKSAHRAKTYQLSSTFSASGHIKTASAELREATQQFDANKTYDVFLSHKFSDAEQLVALRDLLKQYHLTVYVDWLEDTELDRSKVTTATAARLKLRMSRCKCLMFATTDNYSASKWMPWEMGYFDGFRNGRAAIVPISQSTQTHSWEGTEYLGLYPYTIINSLGLCIASQQSHKSITYQQWIAGSNPPAI